MKNIVYHTCDNDDGQIKNNHTWDDDDFVVKMGGLTMAIVLDSKHVAIVRQKEVVKVMLVKKQLVVVMLVKKDVVVVMLLKKKAVVVMIVTNPSIGRSRIAVEDNQHLKNINYNRHLENV